MNPISDSPPTADEALQPLKAGDERFIAALRASHGAKENPLSPKILLRFLAEPATAADRASYYGLSRYYVQPSGPAAELTSEVVCQRKSVVMI
jgi:hypothetical protein